jgi:hypothetical protein
MPSGWTSERKARQAELIRSWRPWERSTGPTSAAGKAVVARNACSGGYRAELQGLAAAGRSVLPVVIGKFTLRV